MYTEIFPFQSLEGKRLGGSFKDEGRLLSFLRKGTLKKIYLISSLYKECVCTVTQRDRQREREEGRETDRHHQQQ